MLKETETEETKDFFVTFLTLAEFKLGEPRAPWAPYGFAYAPANKFPRIDLYGTVLGGKPKSLPSGPFAQRQTKKILKLNL